MQSSNIRKEVFPLYPSILSKGRMVLLLLNLFFVKGFSQFNTPVMDGLINTSEYGSHSNGDNQYLSGNTNYYITWDANNLYLCGASTISLLSEAVVAYLDINPVFPVNGGTNADGSLAGFNNYDDNLINQPFRADFVIYFKNTYHEYRLTDGANGWGSPTSNTLAYGVHPFVSVMEIAIPWNVITNGAGRPFSFNWHACRVYKNAGGNGLYNTAPAGSPLITSVTPGVDIANARNYFTILNTNDGASTKPCSARCLTYYEDNSAPFTGGHYQNGGNFYDFTINDNSSNNDDNGVGYDLPDNQEIANRVLVDGNISISHDLYIGPSSTLLPANNIGPPINATITMSGVNGNLYNYGRIDCNPDVNGVFGDWNFRRLNFIFSGTTTLNAHTIGRSRTRFSNITINPGASISNPIAGLFEFDLQWGTLDNNGTINFGNGSAGTVNFGIRGDVALTNEYSFNTSIGAGQFNFNNIIIGKNFSRLQPTAGGNKVVMNLASDFENYSEFLGFNAGGEIDIVFNGTKKQYIKGNIAESISTKFHNLEINNNNGLNNNNANADVEFLTFGGGQVNYFITGVLKLTSGDLITKERNPPYTIHEVILSNGATVDFTNVKRDIGSMPSSFVDGPLSALENDLSGVLEFPIGKNGDYRKVSMNTNQIAPFDTKYTAELFPSSAIILANSLPVAPELIYNVSNQRFWNIKCDNASNVAGNTITLEYDISNIDDVVPDASGLRIVRANEGGGNSWINLSPFSGGSSNNSGTISSTTPTNVFGDFTFGNASINPLPITLLSFDGYNIEGKNILEWTTVTEINNDYFTIERSVENEVFIPIKVINGSGNSTSVLNYKDIDDDPLLNMNYYRLKQTDYNGQFSYSNTIGINNNLDSKDNSTIFYDSQKDELSIKFESSSRVNIVQLYNSSGQLILDKQFDEKIVSLPIRSISRGIYLCKLISDGVKNSAGYKFLK